MLKNLSIRNKLLLISVIPLLVLAYYVTTSLHYYLSQRTGAEELSRSFDKIEKTSHLIHEIQIERGMTFRYAVTKREEFHDQLIVQRAITDNAIQSLKQLYKNNSLPQALHLLDSVLMTRDDLDSYPESLNGVKEALLVLINQSAQLAENVNIRNQLMAHLNLLYAKEYLARVRSIVEPAVLQKNISTRDFARFNSRVGQYRFNIDRFREQALPELRITLSNASSADDFKRIASLVDSLTQDPTYIREIDEREWWNKSSAAVNRLKQIEDQSMELARSRVEDELAFINRNVYFNIAIGIGLLLTIALLVFLTVQQITAAITHIKVAAERMTEGEVDIHLDDSGHDELSALSRSFNQMINVTKQYAHAAETIGTGDYSTFVKVRGNADILGKALQTMKDNLQSLASENQRRTWLLTGNNEINNSMRGDKEVYDLAKDVLHCLTDYVKAQYGALYMLQNGSLELIAGYALASGQKLAQTIPLGEGLAGQAAATGTHFNIKDVPRDYIQIGSSMGQSPPTNLIVFPFLYEKEVKVVIELASLNEFDDDDLALLQITSDNIAIAFQAAQSRERLKHLLEETQGQSEELMSQQEELRQANDELQEKTEMLERSEEELRAQQEELQHTNVELQEKATLLEEQKEEVERSRAQLEDKARELESTNLYKTEFLANMSHELRTPLNSMLILAQVLMENRNQTLTPKEIQFANTIYNSGADLLALINDILDLSKIEAGKMELDIETFGLIEVPKSLQETFSEVANSKSISFEVRMDNKLTDISIESDRMRLEQVLKNFLSNAFKFTDEGGTVILRIGRPAKQVRFQNSSFQNSEKLLEFAVVDTGIGIPPEKLGPIFEAFQQGDGSTKRKYGGTGLGLSISRQLATLLGGEIHVESALGKGSTFAFYIPENYGGAAERSEPMIRLGTPAVRKKAEPANFETPKDGEPTLADDKHIIAETDRKILIMEDDEEFAKILLQLVRERHYKGIIATHGHLGLNYARYYKPDAILLDMSLPVMDGAEVLRHLKRDPELRHIPVQIISGKDRRKETLELGAFDFIQKPVSKKDLWKALDKMEDFMSRKIKKLLIIEDDKPHSNAVRELIGNGDVQCFAAYTAESALSLLRSDRFDCVILDLGLPDVNGFDLLENIKSDAQFNTLPVIVYTGRSLTREENGRLEKLASAVVVKTAYSHERLLDETTLFLHRVESRLPKDKQKMIRTLHKADEVLKNKKVLIVDDDVRNVYSLVAAFEHEGLICLSAENGKAALDILKKDREIDLVIMDVMMPEMAGRTSGRCQSSASRQRR
jgi:signal transduction histidine kinase/DNA-binding response OmpR family regulator